MFASNDDEELFPTNTSSNLTSLFGGGSNPSAQTNLKYTAPRQPKEKSENVNVVETTKVSVICAKVVLANKLVNDEFVKVGKLGFAILGTKESIKEFLLYKDKQNVLSKATINDNFYINEEGDLWRFIDDSKVIWTVQFVNSDDYDEFVKELNGRNVKIKIKPQIPNKDFLKKDNIVVKEENLEDSFQIRADILTRMARMGQSVLPGSKLDNIITNESKLNETQIENKNINDIEVKNNQSELSKTYQESSPNQFSSDQHLSHQSSSNQSSYQQFSSQQESFQQSFSYYQPQNPNNSQIQQYIPIQTYQYPQIQPNQEFSMFMSENRTHNSEMRINMTSISNKLDTILSEISKLKISPNTDRLENEFLKAKIFDLEEELKKNSSNVNVEELKSKIVDLEGLIKSKDDYIKELKDKNCCLEDDLKDLNLKLSEKSEIEMNIEGLRQKEEELLKEIDELKSKLRQSDDNCKEIEKKFDEKNVLCKNLLEENERLKELKENKSGENKLSSENVKEIMNEMFQNVLSEFQEDQDNFKQIKNVITRHLKIATFNIIDCIDKS